MTAQMIEIDCLGETFTAALLITGSVKQAEAALLDSIESCGPDCDQAFIRTAALSAVHRHAANSPAATEMEAARSLLPAELQLVLRLSPKLRTCFVLRFLAAMTPESCAVMLNVTVDEVDDAACAAVKELARMQ